MRKLSGSTSFWGLSEVPDSFVLDGVTITKKATLRHARTHNLLVIYLNIPARIEISLEVDSEV